MSESPHQDDRVALDVLLVPSPRPASLGRRAARGLFGWLPLCVGLGVFAQLALCGLRPALAEREHLARMRELVELRHSADFALHDELALRERARQDPIFRERRRRIDGGPSWAGR
jgi:hypothetical protein